MQLQEEAYECPLDGKCRAENIVYKFVASVHRYPNKVFLGTTESDSKQHFYNHQMSFNNEGHSTDTTVSKYIGSKEEVQDNVINKMVPT